MDVHVGRAQQYPFNKSHVQVLEGHVLSPEIYVGKHIATFSNCPITGHGLRAGDSCWSVRDLGPIASHFIPTDDQIRDLARVKLAELAKLGLYKPEDRTIDGLFIPKEFFLPKSLPDDPSAS